MIGISIFCAEAIVAITENGIVIDDSTLTGELVEGNTVTGGTSGATATVDEVKKPSGLITELRSFGPNWKTIDYQKFFTHGGFSNKDDEDSNIRMEGPERERLSKEGTHRNPLRFNLEFVSVGDTPNWPTTDNYEIVGRLIMEDGNYLLSEVAQGDEQIIYEDGDTPRLEEHGTGGAWTLEHFKDIVLGDQYSYLFQKRNQPLEYEYLLSQEKDIKSILLDQLYLLNIEEHEISIGEYLICLLYTSDAADE